MKLDIDYKVPGGKLIRLELEIIKDIIKRILITGDFFIYPEEKITNLEECLFGCRLSDLVYTLDRCIKENQITLVGFSSEDIYKAIKNTQKKQILY